MRVADILSSPLVAVEADDTLVDAAQEMEDNGLAAVAVLEGGVLVGILSARDIVRAAADGARLDRTLAQEYMTASPVTFEQDAAPEDALRAMLDGSFSHLPLVDDDGELRGVLTMPEAVASILRVSGGRRRG